MFELLNDTSNRNKNEFPLITNILSYFGQHHSVRLNLDLVIKYIFGLKLGKFTYFVIF